MPVGKPLGRKPIFSPTRLNAYLDCAVKYRYLYIDKIGKFYQKARAGYSFGSTLHHALQTFHEQGGVASKEEMTTQMERSWISAGYESVEQEKQTKETGVQIVEAYYTAHQERAIQKVETIFTEKTITCEYDLFKLTGRVDRIDRHADGSLEIIDYKSGRLETSSDEVANSLAMSCYQLILRKLYPDTRVFATIYALRGGVTASYELAGDDFNGFEREILRLGEEIIELNYEFLEPEPLEICPDCDFLSRCQRFWAQQRRGQVLDDAHSDDGL